MIIKFIFSAVPLVNGREMLSARFEFEHQFNKELMANLADANGHNGFLVCRKLAAVSTCQALDAVRDFDTEDTVVLLSVSVNGQCSKAKATNLTRLGDFEAVSATVQSAITIALEKLGFNLK